MNSSDLRQAAVDQLVQRSRVGTALDHQTPQDLIHELRVHQIELEMQNDELRRAQLELEESRDRFSNLFDFAPVGYVTVDSSNRIFEANLTIAELLGVERSLLVGQLINRFISRDDATRLHHHLREISSEKKSGCELTLNQADGSPLRVRFDSILTGDNRRSIAITDLTENDELLRAKRESDERLRIICRAMPFPVTYADQAGTYQFSNAAHEMWFKIPRESIVGKHVSELLGDEIYRTVQPQIKSALAGRVCACQFELPGRIELPDGVSETRSVEVHYAPLRDDKDRVVGFYELMFDVSTNVHVAAQLARRQALEANLRGLSRRQRNVFDLLISGKSNKVIALELDLGMRTIERERHQILERVGVSSINELLVKFADLADATDPDQQSQ